jgi:hypothetical protein
MCDENIEIGVTEITNNILVSATPTDQKIDINVTETTEEVAVNVTPSVVEVNIDVTQELITEIVTIDANTCVNIVDVAVTDASDNVTLNITPSIVEVNINRGGGSGSSEWGAITGTLSDQTDLQSAIDAKQDALGYTPVPSTRTITINGVTYDLSANRSWTVAGGLSGSGTTGYLTKWTGSSALGNSIAYEDAGNFLIGTTSSLYKLTVNTASGVNFGVGKTSLFGTNDAVFLNSVNDSYTSIPLTINASHIGLYIGYSEKLRINALGNVLIGTTTGVTGGGLLQVNGIINSGEYGLLGGYVGLDTTPTTTPSTAGTLSWNDTDGTADLKLKGGNVTLQIGQEEVVRVVNKTGATLNEADFRAVRVRSVSEGGAQGQRLAVVLAQGDSDADSATTIGLVTESISNNQEGFITTFGNVSEIDTTGAKSWGGAETWVDGDMLYLSPTHAGYLTKVKPVAPQHMVIVGYVVYAHAVHGKIFVKVDNGYELDELHNVLITSPSNGQALVYDSTNALWKNQNITAGLSGSGTTNYIPKWSSSSALTNSLLFDNGTNVGINTNAPSTLFHTYYNTTGTTYTDIALFGRSGGRGLYIGGNGYGFSLNADASGADWGIRTDWDSGYMKFHYGASEKMRINSSGNVGIGLTNPSYKLDVSGDVNITGTYRVNGVAIGGGSGTVTSVAASVPTGFSISGSPITTSGTLAITFSAGYSLPTLASQTNWDTAYTNRITSASSPLSITSNVISISQATTSTNGYLSSTDWNTFNGKQAALTNPVTGTGTSGYLAKWNSSSSINGSIIYDNGTNVGIGTTSSLTYKLNVNGEIFAWNLWTQESAWTIGTSSASASITGFGTTGYAGTTNTLIFNVNASERMRINSSGNVGIGTSSPTAMGSYKILEVQNATGGILRLTNTSAQGGYIAGNGGGLTYDTLGSFPHIFYTNGTERLKINNDGNLILPWLNQMTQIMNYDNSYRMGTLYQANNRLLTFFSTANDGNPSITFNTRLGAGASSTDYGTEKMRITSGGLVAINNTSAFSNEKLRITGSSNIWGIAIFENNQNQADVNHGVINIVNTRTTYAIGNDASIMFSAYNSTLSMQPRASIGMKVSSDLGGELVFNTRNNSGYGERMRIKENGIINFANVPTSSAGLSSGDIYKIGGALMIV